MHSDVPPVGKIESSNPMIDKIWQATNNSYLSNLMGYPTDCPQREKNGWTGDAQIAVETGLYNFDAITVYEKWLADLRDEQQPNGVLPSIVPSSGWGYEWGNGPDWTSAIAIIPWNVYLFYGDTTAACGLLRQHQTLRRSYRWTLPLRAHDLGARRLGPGQKQDARGIHLDLLLLCRCGDPGSSRGIASTKRPMPDSTAKLAQKIKSAFNTKYLNPSTGNYDQGFQTELECSPILAPRPYAEFITKTAACLAARVEADSVKLDVGLLGTKTILNALSENGYPDLAYRLGDRRHRTVLGLVDQERRDDPVRELADQRGQRRVPQPHHVRGDRGLVL